MTMHKIEVSEYECKHCGYKWINRVNGKDGPMPQRCAKCKKAHWNLDQNDDRMTPKESGLRRRIKNLYDVYKIAVWRVTSPMPDCYSFSVDDYYDRKVVAEFLALDNPRPTIKELIAVLIPPSLKLAINSQNFIRYECWYPDPEKPGWLRRERWPCKNYLAAVKSDAQIQIQAMQQIIKSRQPQAQEKGVIAESK